MKRYLAEPGSERVRALFRRRLRVAASRVSHAEVAAAVARAWREKLVDATVRDTLLDRIAADFGKVDVTEVRRAIIERVPALVLRQPLRAYDAVQLVSALTLKERGAAVDFWGADGRLVDAARAEGLRATLVGASE